MPTEGTSASLNEKLKAEIAQHKRAEALLDGQRRVLEMMAADAPLSDSLQAIVLLIEAHVPGMLGSILLIDGQGVHLRHGASPNLPAEYVRAIDGIPIGPQVGSCGTAAWFKEPVIVGDIASDPRWEQYQNLALAHGLRACWSTPILDGQRRLLGTFAMYYRQPALPEPEHLRLIELATHIAALAISRHNFQAALLESEAKLKEAQALANMGYWDRDLIGDCLTWSEETRRIFGVQSDHRSFSQADLQQLIHPDDRRLQRQALDEVLHANQPYDVEYRIIRPDGDLRYVHVRDAIVFDESGRPIRIFGTIQDVTERRRGEELLHAREQEIRAIVENSPDLIVRFDRDLHRTYVNPAHVRANGVPAEQLLGRRIGSTARDGIVNATPEEIAIFERSIEWVRESQRPLDFENTWPGPGGRRSYTFHLEPEFDAHGRFTSILLVGRDITPLKETQRQLLALAENLPDVISRFDREGHYLYVNRAVENLTGIPRGDLIGKLAGEELARRLPEASENLLAYRDAILRVFATGEPEDFLISLPLADGERLVNVRLIAERDDAGGPIVSVLVIGRDITDRQRALEALREGEQRFREVTESIDEVFWLKDVASNEIIYVSPAYEKVWGRSCESLYQAHRSWLNALTPDDYERVKKAAERQLDADYDIEYRIVRPDGSLRWIHDRAFPIRDAAGKVYRIAGVADDITAHRQLEQQFHQAQKMEAIGRLAGGIAHDFNNMLAVIQMATSLILDSEDANASFKTSLQDIMAASERAANLTRQLLTFSRHQEKRATNLKLNEVIDAMIKLLRHILGEDIAIETRFASSLPVVHADPGMIEQIIMNLAVNARDAMPNGGRLSVSLEPVEIGTDAAVAHPRAAPGQFVSLVVSDTGSGIAPEDLSRIFEPFFTTKEVGKGTGLGLATIFGIVEQHRGWIEVESKIGHGTAFRIFLPAVSAGGASPVAEPFQAQLPGGHETILLVEDDISLATICRLVLDNHGYRVFTAHAPADALDIWKEKRAVIDLLLTDLVMPGGTSGRELAVSLLADKPALKVIYASGYSEDIVSHHLNLDPGRTFLQKPYASATLLNTVRRCLDETSP